LGGVSLASAHPTRGLLRAVCAFAAAAALVAGCSTNSTPTGAQPTAGGFTSPDQSITLLPIGQRHTAPAVTGSTLEGRPWTLSDHLGRVVVLNVWASWCAPCRAEAPALKEVSEALAAQGVDFVGLNTRDSNTTARAFEAKYKITYPSVIDQDGRLQLLFGGDVNPNAIPSTIVIDRSGRVAGRVMGRASASTLRALIEPLLEPGAATTATPP
jgi:thiol-disulfide isomerase/thioredoxin